MIWDHSSLFNVIVVRILDVIDSQVIEHAYTNDVEEQDTARFCDVGYLDRVQAEDNRFARTKDTPKDTNVVDEFLRRVCERADPVIDDVVPKLREDPVKHEQDEYPAKLRFVPVSCDGVGVFTVVVASADLVGVRLHASLENFERGTISHTHAMTKGTATLVRPTRPRLRRPHAG
jgi:hypothetical protein